jgi:predicted amidohydrolase
MIIALASPLFPKSISHGMEQAESMILDAAKKKAQIICFPESFIPGYHCEEYDIEKPTPQNLQAALDKACVLARTNNIAVILPMDWFEDDRMLNVAFVISARGEVLGYQSKNQLDPTEDDIWEPGSDRHIFEALHVKFGIVICHEGFRYPEAVRWAAQRDAKIVFHPQFTGSDSHGPSLEVWGHKDNPYYEKAMMMRALENTIYFASVNYATKFAESATTLIGPDGSCIAHERYGKAGVLVAEIDTALATGLLAKRYNPGLYA